MNEPSFTIGVEEEYMLVDRESRDLVARMPDAMLEQCAELAEGQQVTPEFLKSQIEVGTRVSLCAQKEEPPYAYVTAEGPVVGIAEGTHADILELATRYVGEEGGKAYAENMRTAESFTVTIRPETWLAVDYARQQ